MKIKINKKRLFKAIDKMLIRKVLSGKMPLNEEIETRKFLEKKATSLIIKPRAIQSQKAR